MSKPYILWYEQISKKDIGLVGGKNGSLGEMTQRLGGKGINLPAGFALTTEAYWAFIEHNKLDSKLKALFSGLDPDNVKEVQKTGSKARELFLRASFPDFLREEITTAYKALSQRVGRKNLEVAVRSSGVAEDAPTDSFAGQFETFLNIKGEKQLLDAVLRCFASAFNDRVIVYRAKKGIDQLSFALSVGIQQMIRSDLASSGVMFTLDTDTGFDKVVFITAIWGVGEMIVKGHVTPDEFYVFKPTLEKGFSAILRKNLGRKKVKYVFNKKGGLKEVRVPRKDQLRFALEDHEVLVLADWAQKIENLYNSHQDIEWAKDGRENKLYIVQARPETVFSQKKDNTFVEYKLETTKKPLLTGIAVGRKIGQGRVRVVKDVRELPSFREGEVLVTKMTDPDWVSAFPKASAIITDEGGTTSHAAIVAREFGVPAVVGTGVATRVLKTGQIVTVDCSQGKTGRVFEGKIRFERKEYRVDSLPKLPVKIMVNIGSPDIAFSLHTLPVEGVGLARQEFIVANKIRVHPLALYYFRELKRGDRSFCKKWGVTKTLCQRIAGKIERLTVEHKDKREFYIKELAEGIAQIGATFWPKEVILRLSDFKTNEYRNLVGGEIFERHEENPMLGFRGASRYTHPEFLPAFKMECEAIKIVRDKIGLKNISLLIPMCRTPQEGEKVLRALQEFGVLKTGAGDNPKVYVMAEVPSNFLLAQEFLHLFDGMSIGSNDLTQLVFGLDRDNASISHIANENHPALKKAVSLLIKECNKAKKYIGICGEAPSNYPEFALFLVKEGIESISLNPESVLRTYLFLAKSLKSRRDAY